MIKIAHLLDYFSKIDRVIFENIYYNRKYFNNSCFPDKENYDKIVLTLMNNK